MAADGSRVRVYIACSLDGFIAGEGGDLSWLPGADGDPLDPHAVSDPGALSFETFLADVGALLMGRGCYDTLSTFPAWPYGDRPVLVATHQALVSEQPTVVRVAGSIGDLVRTALATARGKDVYLDGGHLIRQAMDANLVDDIVVTQVPIVLGRGIPLFSGLQQRHRLQLLAHYRFAGTLLQVHLRPVGTSEGPAAPAGRSATL